MAHNSKEQPHEIMLELLCCVMVVDKTASATEKTHIYTILSEDDCTWTITEVDRRIKEFIDRVKAQGFLPTLDEACDKASALPVDRVEKLMQNCIALAKGDADFHDRERKAIGRILQKFPQIQLDGISTQQEESTSIFGLDIPKSEWEQPRRDQSV